MSCDRAEQVAMLLDGEQATPALQAHIDVCAECRELLEELRADQSLLREPPEVPQGIVATRVLRQIVRRRLTPYIPSAIAAALFACALLIPRYYKYTAPVDPPPAPQQQRAAAPPMEAPVPVPQLAAPRHHRPTVARAVPRSADPDKLMASLEAMLEPASTAVASADTPVLITTQTADPDVVIVLVPERKGDE